MNFYLTPVDQNQIWRGLRVVTVSEDRLHLMRVTKEDIARMRRLRRRGFSYRAIGRELGCSYNTVRYHLIPAFQEKEKARSKAYCATHPEEKRAYRKAYWKAYRR